MALARWASRLPFWMYRPLLGGRVSGFFLHDVSERPGAIIRHLYRPPTPQAFGGILSLLGREFDFVSLDDVVAHYRTGKPLPRKAAFFSVDDGFVSCRRVIAPMLKQAGIPATFFLTTGVLNNAALFAGHKRSLLIDRLLNEADQEKMIPFLPPEGGQETNCNVRAVLSALRRFPIHTPQGKASLEHLALTLGVDWSDYLKRHRPFMNDDDIRWLLAEGFDIGAHGVDHTKFQYLDDAARAAQVRETVEVLCSRFGVTHVAFSFPNSAAKVTRDWMRRQLEAEPRLSIFVNTGRYQRNDAVMVNRLTLDLPPGTGGQAPGQSTARQAIRVALAKQIVGR